MAIRAGDDGVELLHDDVEDESGPGNGGICTLEWVLTIGHLNSRLSLSLLIAKDGDET